MINWGLRVDRLVANGKKSSLKRSSEQKIVEYRDLPENCEKNMLRKPTG